MISGSVFIDVYRRSDFSGEFELEPLSTGNGPLMNTDQRGSLNALSEQVIGAVFEVSNLLGAGFLEKVYRRALLAELCLLVNFQRPKVEWKRIVHNFQESASLCVHRRPETGC